MTLKLTFDMTLKMTICHFLIKTLGEGNEGNDWNHWKLGPYCLFLFNLETKIIP